MTTPRTHGRIRWGEHFENAAFALFMTVSVTVYSVVASYGILPDMDGLIAALRGFFATYGTLALFVSALIEGIFMVSLYLPGSMVILAAILFSDRSMDDLLVITAVCWAAFMLAALVNYALGYYGFYRIFNMLGARRLLRNTQAWMARYGIWAFVLSAFHPNYIAIVEVAAGIARMELFKTLLLAGVAMLVSGPLMVFGMATVIDTVMSDGGSQGMTVLFIASFAVWSLFILGKGIYSDLICNKGAPHADPL